ncbi:MAG: 2-C-methyl-D-erythritol 2,4-cyclodiphosphate synthase [Zetaproteobacteria bacterium]|nr:2-C-methyl-D-erythritol 2,4-cyclodiphosphate synthase [Zetaproteobacteria bacterium]
MMRVGQGFDVHRLVDGRKLILGGVEVPYHLGLEGHSDADVLIHALCDALLGAAGLGDIGQHFPDTESVHQGRDSREFLELVMMKLHGLGWNLGNADMTVIAQAPKLSPLIAAMRHSLACVIGVDESQLNIKATTTEKLGFTGRGEGIAAQAVVLLVKRGL